MSFLNCRISFGFLVAASCGLSRLPPDHQDPFNRVLVVQAKLNGVNLVSLGKDFYQYLT